MNNFFNFLVYAAIGINSICLALDEYPIEYEKAFILEQINYIVTWVFIGEAIIKISGLGIKTYSIDPGNQFDAIIVVISIIELILENEGNNSGNKKILTIFRGFRMFRVFKLAKKWKSFNRMINKISNSLGDIITFLILLVIVASVFSLLGNEIFAYKVLLDKNGNIIPKPKTISSP